MVITQNIIGKKVRSLRKERKLTLVQLGKICNCSASLLSQIETGIINPSLNTIHAIADAFNMPLVQLVSEINTKESLTNAKTFFSIMDSADRKVITLKNGGVHFELLTHGLNVPFEFILCVYPPGASSGDEPYRHKGEECGYLLEGKLDVQINDDVLNLKSGQTVTLLSSAPHRLVNPGRKKAVAIWVNSIPFIFSTS